MFNRLSDNAKSAKNRLILPLDVSSAIEALRLVDELRDFVGVFKVGIELFGNTGPELFDQLHAQDVSVFFDGKFLDIPNTVAGASRAAASRGVFMFNVHATGGTKMMAAAIEAAHKEAQTRGLPVPKVIAVTVLTSLGQDTLRHELGVARELEEQVCALAKLTQESGLDGVVCSPHEVVKLRKVCGQDFLLVTPGVRPSWASKDDQVRIMTPGDAMAHGADYLVIGRPITAANNRREAAQRIVAEMQEALAANYSP